DTAAVVRRSLLQHSYSGAAGSGWNIEANPQFVDHGGGDFRLRPTSPAIDAGDSTLYLGPLDDAGGSVRLADLPQVVDTGVALGAAIDMGAYEAQPGPPTTCAGDTNGDGRIDFADLNALLGRFGSVCD